MTLTKCLYDNVLDIDRIQSSDVIFIKDGTTHKGYLVSFRSGDSLVCYVLGEGFKVSNGVLCEEVIGYLRSTCDRKRTHVMVMEEFTSESIVVYRSSRADRMFSERFAQAMLGKESAYVIKDRAIDQQKITSREPELVTLSDGTKLYRGFYNRSWFTNLDLAITVLRRVEYLCT